jgi:purine-nucleoside phosphorylase
LQYAEKVNEALSFLKAKTKQFPEAAIVLGSGLGGLADKIENAEGISYADIPYWPRSTAPGHAGKLIIGVLAGRRVAAMQGRVHYYEGYTMQEVTFPTRVLGLWGVKTFVVTNASGAINTSLAAGTIVGLQDHLNLMGCNPLIGQNNDEWGVRFPDMTHPYDEEYLQILEKIAAREKIDFARGIYAAMTGPSFETAAEVRMLRTLGADVVGMSTVPEVIVANHMGMRVCGLSCVANAAAGITGNKLTHQEVLDTMNKTSGSLCRLIESFLKEMTL